VSPADTWRGLAFLAALLSLHLASGAVFDRHRARRRMRALVAVLGLALGLLALTQHALGARRAYFAFESLEGGTPFGPFFNRNHFAGYMLLVVPTSFAVLARAWQRLLERVGARPPLRRLAAALGTAEGMRCVYASLPPVVGVSALIASTSRGALLACACGLLLVLATRRRERAFFALLAASVVAMALGWFGLARLEARFALFAADAPARTRVWKDALERAQGRLLAGTGFNTFGVALHRVPPLELPRGATPWPAELLQGGERPGYRAPEGLPGIEWYREAHNDYLQVLVESGVPGLLLALLAAFEVLRAARRDGWLLWALSAVLLHELVDFDLQIPAIAVVFVVLAATRRRPEVFRQA
jgi:O-antigen ligase